MVFKSFRGILHSPKRYNRPFDSPHLSAIFCENNSTTEIYIYGACICVNLRSSHMLTAHNRPEETDVVDVSSDSAAAPVDVFSHDCASVGCKKKQIKDCIHKYEH